MIEQIADDQEALAARAQELLAALASSGDLPSPSRAMALFALLALVALRRRSAQSAPAT